MTNKQNDPVLNKKLIGILDTLIQEGPWDKSLFLQATGKEIRTLKADLESKLDFGPVLSENHTQQAEGFPPQPALLPSQKEVYVGLYQANGSLITHWENALELLITKSSSRPIYADESNAKDMLIKKANSPNNAYIAIIINKDDIIPTPEKLITDKFGHALLTLKEDALKIEHIMRFVHSTGSYLLVNKNLVKAK